MIRPLVLSPLAAVLLLAACGTPQEQCIRSATRELRTVDRLIAETEASLRRGYAYETRQVTRTEWVVCEYVRVPPRNGDGEGRVVPRYCLDDVTDTVQRPVAIDPLVEKRKLASLTARRKELNRAALADVEACRARYPE